MLMAPIKTVQNVMHVKIMVKPNTLFIVEKRSMSATDCLSKSIEIVVEPKKAFTREKKIQ